MLEITGRLESALKQRSKNIIADWELKPSSVLVPLFLKENEYHLLFTRRTDHLRSHPGQISFPGGKYDDEDRSLLDTALRETQEEIGLERDAVQVLGELDDMLTSTQYRITPFVGFIPYPYEFKLNIHEINHLIEVPVKTLLDPSILETRYHTFYEKYRVKVYYYHIGSEPIWGATARIVKHFLDLFYPLL
ncbi:MAG: CoA pyrophosphatase [Blastocatellia bacterium]|nr:CoA pyrophosphatase [Blastocatellia bacterium]